ncbi:hypothetical protein [Candidatus Methanocrinis natronophilus]|uniref:Uncharacterized protein n=1 Tax=Candidatus Methanocrinis natronophilus TaxID=3033396 RepID=A0ABT5X862_9EURY|nr:hypothetical protein [Candidatus Methanocrinis natronophilus]MDF0590879.1 hypothetical protein [Candidatus Methanocrinis natronophilus]
MSEDMAGGFTPGGKSIASEIAGRIRWTSQGWPVPEGREDHRALQKCYSWLAWRDLPLATVPENNDQFDQFVSSNVFLEIRFDGKDLKSLGFVTIEHVEAAGLRTDLVIVPAAFGAEKMLSRLKALKL